jgi:hypothetical protein
VEREGWRGGVKESRGLGAAKGGAPLPCPPRPPQFIPPLALDSALRLDFFLFRKVVVHMLLTAFVMVAASAFLLIPCEREVGERRGYGGVGMAAAAEQARPGLPP